MKSIFVLLFSIFIALQTLAIVPEYVDTTANKIIMNGEDWSNMKNKLCNLNKSHNNKFNILHIGDSHIQADFVTSTTRRLLQSVYGNGGRGCIAALKLAKTNQPVDYKIYASNEKWIPSRLLKRPWEVTVGVTGIAARPENDKQTIYITTKYADDKFSNISLLHYPGISYDNVLINGNRYDAIINENVYASSFKLSEPTDSVSIELSADSPFYGAVLSNDNAGLIYSAIGNNGACFSDYMLVPQFSKQTSMLNPDLIILSMGTNEAFSNETDNEIYNNIGSLIQELKQANPHAKFLLLTPMECQRNRKHGEKEPSPYFDINTRVKEVRNIIMKYGADNNIPVWDFYAIAGGDNVSNKWLEDKYMNKDHIHLLKSGYEIQGKLLFDALIKELK